MKQACLLTALVLSMGSVTVGQVVFKEQPGIKEFSGEMLATPKSEISSVSVSEALSPYGILEHAIGPNRYWFSLREQGTENEVAAELMATGLFEFVEPNWNVWPVDCPNDPLFSSQWHHVSSKLNSCNGWDLHVGKFPVTVNICDTGIRRTHEDLRNNRREGYNATTRKWERGGGDVDDINGHGTNTTGCAAANGNNKIGIAGIGWNLRHRMSRVSESSGGGSSIGVLLHAAENGVENGDKVSSVSYSGVDSSSVRASASYIKTVGGLLVWAAGNSGENLNWGDRDNDDLIVAGATDSSDRIASFSGRGRSLDVVAPGVSVYTTTYSSDSSYGSVSGTSFSCPLTAGLCALLFSANSAMGPNQVETKLKQGCDDLGDSGVDDTYGHGRIDINGSLNQINNIKDDLDMLLTTKNSDTIGGVSFENNDIVRYTILSQAVTMYFDCSDVISTGVNLNAIHEMDDGTILLSFQDDGVDVPGVGTVNNEDIVQFIPTTLGDSTSGSFAMYFDGSDVDFGDQRKESIDGISIGASGEIYISPKKAWTLPAFSGKNEDVLEFTPSTLGDSTSGSWALVFDGNNGSDEGMGQKGEGIDALDYHHGSFEWAFSTGGAFKVPKKGLSGRRNDLLCHDIITMGASGTGFQIKGFDANANSLNGTNIDGMDLIND